MLSLPPPFFSPAAQIRSQREMMAEVQAHHDAQVRAVLEKYSVLRKVVQQYNQRLGQAVAAPVAAVSGAQQGGPTPMICT